VKNENSNLRVKLR